MKYLIFAAGLLGASPAVANDYTCEQYSLEYSKLANSEINEDQSSLKLQLAIGIIIGAYFTKTQEQDDPSDRTKLEAFESKVNSQCKKTPNANFLETVIKSSQDLKPTAKKPKNNDSYEQVSLTDLKLDLKQLGGKKVEVNGHFMSIGDISMISEKQFSTLQIMVETSKLSRDDRRKLLENCTQGCVITIQGKVGGVLFETGIIAEHIIVD